MPEDVRADYDEARSISERSPRAAAALLRLTIERLVESLGENPKDLNKAIGNLVKKGLPVGVQEALDSVRVVGNNAVHPGEMNLQDDRDTALAMFDLVNMIVERMITNRNDLARIYAKLPKGAHDQIARRDGNDED